MPALQPWPARFTDPDITANGERRAVVSLRALRTLWFNTGTLCNITCSGCYIESSPRNDRLSYLSRAEVREFLAEARGHHPDLREIGFTGGEPFMNPEFPGMLEDALAGGWRALVLTNAMRPMQRRTSSLLSLREQYAAQLTLRVSLDHYSQGLHEQLRGLNSWRPALHGLRWLVDAGFNIAIASRKLSGESEATLRAGFAALFAAHSLPVDAMDPQRLVLFPELDARAPVPEITESCWGILGKSPDDLMCASSRMVVKHRGATRPSVISCTLLPYEPGFDLGATLAAANHPVKLNHPHCAKFCVLGGAVCSG